MAPNAGRRCLDDDDVLAFVEGRLAGASWELVNQHIAGCDACRSLVAETAKFFADQSADSGSLTTVAEVPRRLAPKPARQVAEGQTVGRYVIQRVLGAGGMGVVYLAHDIELHRSVALKLLRPDPQSDERLDEARSRLLREAQAMARVSHPNVVAIYDVGRFEEQVFLAMEYVSSGTLLGYLRERARSWREVIELCLQAGRGLAAAHAANLVHRDFKPANVLLGEDGRVRVTDFGLAFMSSAAPAAPASAAAPADPPMLGVTLTRTGVLLGTPAYASPEQLRGQSADPRSDQFSFCVTLYEALYRRRPFLHESFAALVFAVNSEALQPPPPGTDVPPALFEILRRGLRADPDQRYARMDDLLGELTAVLAATSVEIVLPGRRVKRAAIAAVLASAAVALALIAVWATGSPPAPAASASRGPSTLAVPPVTPAAAPPPAEAALTEAPPPSVALPTEARVAPAVAPARAPASPARAGAHVATKSTHRHAPPTKRKARKPPGAPPVPKVDGDALKPLHEDGQ
jgi:eukaryotic-like serine/threonine-protein kinase